MTNRSNLRRRKAKDRRREEAKVDEVLERARRQARRQARGLSEPRSVYALVDEIQGEEARKAALEAIDRIVREEMVEPHEPSRLIYRRPR